MPVRARGSGHQATYSAGRKTSVSSVATASPHDGIGHRTPEHGRRDRHHAANIAAAAVSSIGRKRCEVASITASQRPRRGRSRSRSGPPGSPSCARSCPPGAMLPRIATNPMGLRAHGTPLTLPRPYAHGQTSGTARQRRCRRPELAWSNIPDASKAPATRTRCRGRTLRQRPAGRYLRVPAAAGQPLSKGTLFTT